MTRVMFKVDGVYYRVRMDGYLTANLDSVKRNLKRDYDAFILITGREGYGKSTLAMQVAKYLDKSFDLDRVVFTADQFMEAVDNAKRFQAIVFDETMGYLSSRGAMSKFNRALIKVMSEMRFKNLAIILCIPNFFEMDRYPAMHRSTGLLHIYRRAKFASYDYNKKRLLYVKGKKHYSYSVPPSFIGDFNSFFTVNKESYEKKKLLAMQEWYKNQKSLEKSTKKAKEEEVILYTE